MTAGALEEGDVGDVGGAGTGRVARARARTAILGVGARVGPYRILGELGRGGMGVVYRAVHALLERPVALKVLRPELVGDPASIERMRIEARATMAVRHASVVELYDLGDAGDGAAYLAMELLEGETLAQRIAARGPLPVGEALAVARQVAVAIAAAHAAGVVHRDLKPDNVFLDARGAVKLFDFGIAIVESLPVSSEPPTDGMIVGTPSYMAPEQCVGVGACDHRADLYALGCLLFEMLAGRPPYAFLPAHDVLVAHVRAPVPALAELVKVPTEVSQLVTRLLAKQPRHRPGDARGVAEALAEIETWVAFAASQTAPHPPVEPVPERPSEIDWAVS